MYINVDGKDLDSLRLDQGDKTSTYLAYRPNFADYHQSGLGAVFVNLKQLYPCIGSTAICHIASFEEDGFRKGKAYIEAGDSGADFNMFGTGPVYGLAVQGCGDLNDPSCFKQWQQSQVVCYLPQDAACKCTA